MVQAKFRVGVEDLSFDAAHYTKGVGGKCMNIHGHTFRVNVEVEGEVDPETGFVIDFSVLKKIVKEVIEEYDHKVIVPKKDVNETFLKGKFRGEIKVLDYPEASTEYIALDIARKIHEKLNMPVKVKLFEGLRNYVIVEIRK